MNRTGLIQRRRIAQLGALLIAAVLLLGGCSGGSDRSPLPGIDRRDLVRDADLVVRCSDAGAFSAAVARSPLGLFWHSPEMEALREGWHLEEAFGRALTEGKAGAHAERMRQIYLEQLKLLDGEVVLAFDFGDFSGPPAVTVVAALGTDAYRRSLEMDRLLIELKGAETITASEDFRGVTITTYLSEEDAGDRFFYQAFYDGTVLASEDRRWLEQALIRLMAARTREPEGDPVLTATGTARLLDRLQASMVEKAAQGGAPFDPQTVFHGLGLDSVGDVQLALAMRADRAEVVFQAARRGEWNRGLMVLVPAEPAPQDFRLAHVPSDVAGYQVFRMDLDALWRQIPEILRQIAPDHQLQFSMGVNAAGGLLDIDLNEELFGNLERLGFTYARIGDAGQELVYGFRVKDAGAMARTLDKLFAEHSPLRARLGEVYRRTEIQDHRLHMLQLQVPAGRGGAMTLREVGMTVIDRALVVGEGGLLVDHVQAAVHHQGEAAFYTSPLFTDMLRRVPAEACSYGVSDLGAYARFFTDRLRRAAEDLQAAGFASPAGAGGKEAAGLNALIEGLAGLDVAKMPSPERVGAYFGTSDGYSLIDDAGFRSTMTLYYPQP